MIDARISFALACERGVWLVGQLSTAFGISRKTGYEWRERYRRYGKPGLADRSRTPHRHPNGVSEGVVKLILDHRQMHLPNVFGPAVRFRGSPIRCSTTLSDRRRARGAPARA